jgi:arylsulfatase A-like enzyme
MTEKFEEKEPKDKLNVIILLIDAFRPKHLSLFGYKKETDKNLKKIASESILFKKHFSTSNSTAPALTSIFSGLYPKTHGILHQFPYTTQEEIDKMEKKVEFWLPSYLKNKGYETLAIDWIGMWFERGFDYYKEKEEKESKIKKFMNIPLIKKSLLSLPNWAYKFGKKIVKVRSSAQFPPPDEAVELAITKIKGAEKPFFLFMHFWNTHFPFPTTSYKGSGKNDIDELIKNIKSDLQREYVKKRIVDIDLYSMEDIINKYDLTIEDIDKAIGKLYDFLKNEELWQNTLLIILGDHGTSIKEHGIYFSHSGLYDVSVHVPLIMHFPNLGAREIDSLVQNVDIVPTILDFLGFETDKKFDGKSMMPSIINGKKIRKAVFLFDGLCKDIRAVRTETRKLIIAKNPECNLCKAKHVSEIEEYDLEKDPEELNNIYSGSSELMKFLK